MRGLTVKINGEVRQLSEWADLYGISRCTIWQRYHAGCVGDELIAPLSFDVLDEFYLHKLWGGKWVYRSQPKTKNKYYRNHERWVYIGNPEKMSV